MPQRCPHCATELRPLAVLSTGPLRPRPCDACGQAYFCGGAPMGLLANSTGLLLGYLAARWTSGWLLPGLLMAGGMMLAIAWMLRAQPLPASQRRRQTLLILLGLSPLAVPLLLRLF
jgi:hypothetical protein